MLLVYKMFQALDSTAALRLVLRFGSWVRLFGSEAWTENTLADVLGVVIHKFERLLYNVVLAFIAIHRRVNFTTFHNWQFFLSKSMRVHRFTLIFHLIDKFIAHKVVSFSHFDVFI